MGKFQNSLNTFALSFFPLTIVVNVLRVNEPLADWSQKGTQSIGNIIEFYFIEINSNMRIIDFFVGVLYIKKIRFESQITKVAHKDWAHILVIFQELLWVDWYQINISCESENYVCRNQQ